MAREVVAERTTFGHIVSLRAIDGVTEERLVCFYHERLTIARQAVAVRGRRLEYFTIAWNTLEGLVAVVAGALAGSISLVGFGIDSFIEVTSGSALLWRMSVDADVRKRERREKLSLRIVGVCFSHWPLTSVMNLSPTSSAESLLSTASPE